MVHVDHLLTSLLTGHPLAVLAVTIVLGQAGIPVPSAPILLLIGALAGSESVSIPLTLFVAVPAAVCCDCLWFVLGRSRRSNPGRAFKRWKAGNSRSFRIAHWFDRHGGVALLAARFIPGPNLAAAFAGRSRRSKLRFVLRDTIASGIWAMIYLAAGRFLPRELRLWLSSIMSASPGTGIPLVLGIVAVFLGVSRLGRYLNRRRASRLGVPDSIASETCLNPEVVQLETV